MEPSRRKAELPPIPAKRYFTIGEVSDLCGVKPELLYEEGFTISGARNRLDNSLAHDEKPDLPARNSRAAGPNGVDVAAIKRELRAVLDQLQS